MRKDTANWIALADYDIETARHMLATERYLYVVFLCHLALEKLHQTIELVQWLKQHPNLSES